MPLENITFILHKVRAAENVGASARALANMGLGRLILAEPTGFDRVRAERVARHAGERLEAAEVAPSLEALLPRFGFLVATTARPREGRPSLTPEQAAAELLARARTGVPVAILFGEEKNGLPRWALDRAHALSTVPTYGEQPSLNLAQAVLLYGYVLRNTFGAASAEEATEGGASAPTGAPPNAPAEGAAAAPSGAPPNVPAEGAAATPTFAPPMPPEDLARLRERARALLLAAGYLNPQQPDRVLGELERLLLRAGPTEREGHLLLGLVRQLEWAVGRGA